MKDPRRSPANVESTRPWTRREFVKGTGLAAAGTALGLRWPLGRLSAEDSPAGAAAQEALPIPHAKLGKTGLEVSILGLGTALLGHQNNNRPSMARLVDVFSEAIDRGITYVDTARIYGGAEEALKSVLKTRREKVTLATKVWANTREEVDKSFEESLQRLGVDSVDVLHLHSTGDKEIDKVLGPGGAWERLLELKKAGKTRCVGLTGHSRPMNFVRVIETGTADVLMCAMNFVDRHIYGFEEKVLPVAVKHEVGVLAMKVYGGVRGGFKNYPSPTPFPSQLEAEHHETSISYVKSLEGVTAMVIGVHSKEQLHQNVDRVLRLKPLSPEEFQRVCDRGKEIAKAWEPRFGPVA